MWSERQRYLCILLPPTQFLFLPLLPPLPRARIASLTQCTSSQRASLLNSIVTTNIRDGSTVENERRRYGRQTKLTVGEFRVRISCAPAKFPLTGIAENGRCVASRMAWNDVNYNCVVCVMISGLCVRIVIVGFGWPQFDVRESAAMAGYAYAKLWLRQRGRNIHVRWQKKTRRRQLENIFFTKAIGTILW